MPESISIGLKRAATALAPIYPSVRSSERSNQGRRGSLRATDSTALAAGETCCLQMVKAVVDPVEVSGQLSTRSSALAVVSLLFVHGAIGGVRKGNATDR